MNEWGLNAAGEWVWAWVPAALVALYLFRPRHQVQRVPAAFLWRQVADKLGGQRLWRRLQQQRLLWLQLLFCFLALLALLRPFQVRPGLVSRQVVLLLDTSASMQAGGRLTGLLQEAQQIVAQAPRGTEFLLATADRELRLLQPFTADRREIARQLGQVRTRALRGRDELLPAFVLSLLKNNPEAQVHWFSDHALAGLPHVPHLALQGATNYALESFQAGPSGAFLALKNYHHSAAQVQVRVEGPDGLRAERVCTLKGEGRTVLNFPTAGTRGTYHARIVTPDELSWDNQAWAQVEAQTTRSIVAHGEVSAFLEAGLQAATGAPLLRQTEAQNKDAIHLWPRLPGALPPGLHVACAPPPEWLDGNAVEDEGPILVAESARNRVPIRIRSNRWGARYRLGKNAPPVEPVLVTREGEALLVQTKAEGALIFLFALESSELPMSPELPVLLSALLRSQDAGFRSSILCGTRLRLAGPGPVTLRSAEHEETLQGAGAELDWTPSWPGLYQGTGRSWAVNFHAPDESDLDAPRPAAAPATPSLPTATAPAMRPMSREWTSLLVFLGLLVLLYEWRLWNGTRR
jgi:hypothetical protein